MADYAKDVLVETDWVAEHLDDDDIRIVEVDENPALYAEAHIPGAIGFDWKADLQDQVKRDFLGPEDFGELMGSRGISNDHTVVLYGDRNNWFAAYTYWYFRYYGHDKVKLINGPREKWIARGARDHHRGPRPTRRPSSRRRRATTGSAPMRDEVLKSLDSKTHLVDVRSPQEYSGELIAMAGYEQEGAQRAGHIPGAASVPWAQAVNEDGTFKSADELRELYEGKGVVDGGDPIIAYCRIGERSAHTWFVLQSCSARTTSRTTTAPGRSGGTSWTCRSRRTSRAPAQLHFTTRYLMWVTPGASIARSCSSSSSPTLSSSRSPPPRTTGTMWSSNSSISPADRYCWATLAPPWS